MDRSELEPSCDLGQGEGKIVWEEIRDVFTPSRRPLVDFLKTVEVEKAGPDSPPYIFFSHNAFEIMLSHAEKDISREHGGILAGETYQDEASEYYTLVQTVVPAKDTIGSPTRLQFRAESWENVWKELDANPALNIVGWYHTHPGLGVFLSGTDLKTQRLYFSNPWQIAVVIDPVRNDVGFFYGANGKKVHFVRKFSYKELHLASPE